MSVREGAFWAAIMAGIIVGYSIGKAAGLDHLFCLLIGAAVGAAFGFGVKGAMGAGAGRGGPMRPGMAKCPVCDWQGESQGMTNCPKCGGRLM